MNSENLSKKDQLFLKNTRKRVGKAIHKYKLIEEGDEVLIAVSGGKDSLFLLESLARHRKHIPFNFNIKAIHIEVDDSEYEIDKVFLENLCRKYDVPIYYKHINIGNLEESDKSPCFVCSNKRRYLLFSAVEELGCNKLALGHHMDDAVETLLLNMTFHANISSMPPKLDVFDGKFSIIRPLILTEEENIIEYTRIQDFPSELKLCPFEEKGNRFEMKKVLSLLSKMNENARINILRSMGNIDNEYLPQ